MLKAMQSLNILSNIGVKYNVISNLFSGYQAVNIAYALKRNESLNIYCGPVQRASHPRVECLAPTCPKRGGTKPWSVMSPRAAKEI